MKKLAISAAVLIGISVLAVLILNVFECQGFRPDPTPDAAITTSTSIVAPVPAKDVAMSNTYMLIQLSDSGLVQSAPDGKYLLILSGVRDSVEFEDGSRTMSLNAYVELVFGGNKMVNGTLDYEESRGPVEVRLSSPIIMSMDGGPMTISYSMKVVGGKQILAEFGKTTLRVKPLP